MVLVFVCVVILDILLQQLCKPHLNVVHKTADFPRKVRQMRHWTTFTTVGQ